MLGHARRLLGRERIGGQTELGVSRWSTQLLQTGELTRVMIRRRRVPGQDDPRLSGGA